MTVAEWLVGGAFFVCVALMAFVLWSFIRPPRRVAGDFFGEITADPDRHRSSELPDLHRGWREGM